MSVYGYLKGNITVSIVSFQFACSLNCSYPLSQMSHLNQRYTLSSNWTFHLNKSNDVNTFSFSKNESFVNVPFVKGSMIVYWLETDESNSAGRIALTSIPKNQSDILWDVNDGSLNSASTSFYVTVNGYSYSKQLISQKMKRYFYPGVYNLICSYPNDLSNKTFSRIVTVSDRKYSQS